MNEKTIDKKNLILKIIIVVTIVFVIVAVWILKNSESDSSLTEYSSDYALNVTEKLDMEQFKSYGVPILIEFGSDSCQPCQEMAPIIEELNEELQGKAIIKFVEVWDNPEYAEGYPISVIPTQLFIDSDGNPYTPKSNSTIQFNMYSSEKSNQHAFTTHEGTISKDELLAILTEMGM